MFGGIAVTNLLRRLILLAPLCGLAATWPDVSSFAEPVKAVQVEPGFRPVPKASGGTKPANDLSGLFCRPRGDNAFRCLVINDESTVAEWADYVGTTLTPVPGPSGAVPLRGVLSSGAPNVFGDRNSVGKCGKADSNFDASHEFDGEAVAWTPGPEAGGTYYVVGSHSCSRKHPEEGLKLSTHMVARIQMLASGPKVDLTWRLGPALQANAAVGDRYNQPLLPEPGGLDIEGAAVIGDRLYLGLRAPATHHATILSVAPAALFTPATPGEPVALTTHKVALGPHVGIRDLAALPDGRLLFLSGPAQDQSAPFGLHLVRPSSATDDWGTPTTIVADVRPPSKAKAEGLAVLSVEGREVRVLILFEKPEQGAREYSVSLPN